MSLVPALSSHCFFNLPRVARAIVKPSVVTTLFRKKQPSISSITKQFHAMSLKSDTSTLKFEALIKQATTVPPNTKELYFSDQALQKKQREYIEETLLSGDHARICVALLSKEIVLAMRKMFENPSECSFSVEACEHMINCMADLTDYYDHKLIYYVVKYYCCNHLEGRLKNPPTDQNFYKTIIRILLFRDKYTLNFINDRSEDYDAVLKKVTSLLNQALIFYCEKEYANGALSPKLAFMLDDFSKESNHFPDLREAANKVIMTSLKRLSKTLLRTDDDTVVYSEWPLNMVISLYIACVDYLISLNTDHLANNAADKKFFQEVVAKVSQVETIVKARLVQNYVASGEKEKLEKKYRVRNPGSASLATEAVVDCDALLRKRAQDEIDALRLTRASL